MGPTEPINEVRQSLSKRHCLSNPATPPGYHCTGSWPHHKSANVWRWSRQRLISLPCHHDTESSLPRSWSWHRCRGVAPPPSPTAPDPRGSGGRGAALDLRGRGREGCHRRQVPRPPRYQICHRHRREGGGECHPEAIEGGERGLEGRGHPAPWPRGEGRGAQMGRDGASGWDGEGSGGERGVRSEEEWCIWDYRRVSERYRVFWIVHILEMFVGWCGLAGWAWFSETGLITWSF